MNLLSKIKEYCKENYSQWPYHNFYHALDVFEIVTKRGKTLSSQEQLLLQIAALFHDIVVMHKSDDEINSAKVAESFLKNYLSKEEIEIIIWLIKSTKMPQRPKNHLQQILCDADLDNLGREDFFEKNQLLRHELNKENKEWLKESLEFLKQHKYHTSTARKERNKGKEKNIKKLENIQRSL